MNCIELCPAELASAEAASVIGGCNTGRDADDFLAGHDGARYEQPHTSGDYLTHNRGGARGACSCGHNLGSNAGSRADPPNGLPAAAQPLGSGSPHAVLVMQRGRTRAELLKRLEQTLGDRLSDC